VSDQRRVMEGDAYVVYPSGEVRPLTDTAERDDEPRRLDAAIPPPISFLTETGEATRIGARPRV
jgi:hypothetical protein